MSTSFYVLPSKAKFPTYDEIITSANADLKDFLMNIGVSRSLLVNCSIKEIQTNETNKFEASNESIQTENNYVWFYFYDIPGGIDCYFHKILPINIEAWEYEINNNINAQRLKSKISENLNLGFQWIFRRSAGQSAIVSLLFGLLAATLAKLTDGIIYSEDGALDYAKFPTTSYEFLSWYFKPEYATTEEDLLLANRCIKQLKAGF